MEKQDSTKQIYLCTFNLHKFLINGNAATETLQKENNPKKMFSHREQYTNILLESWVEGKH